MPENEVINIDENDTAHVVVKRNSIKSWVWKHFHKEVRPPIVSVEGEVILPQTAVAVCDVVLKNNQNCNQEFSHNPGEGTGNLSRHLIRVHHINKETHQQCGSMNSFLKEGYFAELSFSVPRFVTSFIYFSS